MKKPHYEQTDENKKKLYITIQLAERQCMNEITIARKQIEDHIRLLNPTDHAAHMEHYKRMFSNTETEAMARKEKKIDAALGLYHMRI